MNELAEHTRWINRAVELAVENVKAGGGPFGCVIVKDGECIAEGVNRVTSNCDPTAHAEIQAIRNACSKLGSHQLSDCILYSSCEPCPMCLGAIYWARPNAVFFAARSFQAANVGFDDSFIYEELQLEEEDRRVPWMQITVSQSDLPFLKWQNTIDKKEY
jgi:guanine deaminase